MAGKKFVTYFRLGDVRTEQVVTAHGNRIEFFGGQVRKIEDIVIAQHLRLKDVLVECDKRGKVVEEEVVSDAILSSDIEPKRTEPKPEGYVGDEFDETGSEEVLLWTMVDLMKLKKIELCKLAADEFGVQVEEESMTKRIVAELILEAQGIEE